MNKIELAENIKVVQSARNVLTVYVDKIGAGWELPILLRSDAHHDSMYCDRAFEKEHLEEVKEKNGFVADFGDIFDAMQGKYDPRKSYSELRPEYKVDNYLDEIVTDAAKFYAPFSKNFLLIGPGNHESSILLHNGVDLINNLIYRINSDYNGKISRGYYGGYIRFVFNSGKSCTKVLKYFHGSSIAMTKPQLHKQGFMYSDADIVVNGHAHESWHVAIKRERLSERGVVYKDLQHHIRTATYKDDYVDGAEGWTVEGGKSPAPLGAVWIRFYYKNHSIELDVTQSVR